MHILYTEQRSLLPTHMVIGEWKIVPLCLVFKNLQKDQTKASEDKIINHKYAIQSHAMLLETSIEVEIKSKLLDHCISSAMCS